MNRVSRSPLRVIGRRPLLPSLLRVPAAFGLALSLLAPLAPLGTVARAQGAPAKGQQFPIAEEQLAYVVYQTPEGETACRLALPGEIAPAGEREQQLPVRQINHLEAKDSVTASASAGLTIILRATARLEANPEAKQAFINAAAKWEALISSQITVTIDVDYGPDFFGNTTNPYGSNTLGQTSQGGFLPSYADVRARLINRAPAGSEEATLLSSLPASSLPTDIGNVTRLFAPSSVMRALGFSATDNDITQPKIGFNTNFPFDLNPDDGVNSTQTDFDSVAVHEIGHVLGFNSQVGSRELDPNRELLATVWDIYRFRPGAVTAGTFSSAPRVLSSGTTNTDPHVHFNGGAELPLSTGKPDGTGGDERQASHWKDDRLSGLFVGIMDPTIQRGRHETISANDIRAIDFFGYSVGQVPAPPNDNFASAQALSGSTGRATGTNRGATKEAGEPSHSPDGNPGGKSVWYAWSAPSSGSVTFNTGQGASGEPASTFDTLLAAYTGTSVGALTAVAKNDDVSLGQITTSTITFNAVGGTTYRIAVDGYDGDVGNVALNWSHTGSGGGQSPTVQFSAASLSVSEGGGRVTVTVTRAGDTSGASTVDYRTADTDAFTVGCADAAGAQGSAFARCDFATAVGSVAFAPGETTKTVAVPVIDDGHVEGAETFRLELSGPSGASLGAPNVVTVTIVDNDAAGQANPVTGPPFGFFVRQQYLDFLSREPDDAGFNSWLNVLNTCANPFNLDPNSSSAGCDRILVSKSFFLSPEFALKGFYAFRFYRVAFNRLPEYAEITADMSFVAGATEQEVFARRADLAVRFTNRQEFALAYGGMTNAQYVAALLGRYNLTQVTTPDPANPDGGVKVSLTGAQLTDRLNAGTLSRAQVLRAVADSDQVDAAEFNNAFVAMQYYGYLRRKPEQSGFEAWLRVVQGGDVRGMVNGFLNSAEYKLRFGQP